MQITTAMAGAEGFEPSARGFGDRCSTNWAIPLNKKMWWTIRDSNPGPTGYEPVALTNWANGPHRAKKIASFLGACITTSRKREEILVTRGRIELPMPAWEAGVLTAWPTGHIMLTCSIYRKTAASKNISARYGNLVHHRGLEPRTHWLRVSCSTIWANGA